MAVPKLQLLSRTQYDTDGTTTVWDFNFSGGYILQDHVKAYYDDAGGIRTTVVVTPAMLIGTWQLQITPAIPAGNVLTIYRATPKDQPMVDFVDRGSISEVALDTLARQAVFVAAEASDDTVTANSDVAVNAAGQAQAAQAAAVAASNNAAASAALADADRIAADASAVAAAASATSAATAVTSALGATQLGGFRNLLINGNFAINQRKYTSGTATSGANQYTLDRWRVVTSGQALTFSTSGTGNSITAPAGGVEQVIESINVGGGTYVLNWVGTATATVNGTARSKGESFTLPANTNATVRLSNGTASLVQLEQGAVVTQFEYRPLEIELLRCARYLPAVLSTSTADFIPGAGYVASATTVSVVVPFIVEPRVAPTGALVSASTHFTVNAVTGGGVASAVTFSSATKNSARLAVTQSGMTAGQIAQVFFNTATAFVLFTGCEL